MTSSTKIVLGLMSGSSLDGLDLALVKFDSDFKLNRNWEIIAAETLAYSSKWIAHLKLAKSSNAPDLHKTFGTYLSELVNQFLKNKEFQPTLIAVHGHTLVHDPKQKVSIQLGSAQNIANGTNIPCIDDFRIQDILLGGQGAPIAPTVEHWMLKDYQCFLNIGGILNLSHHRSNEIIAFDIGAGNQLLNSLANEVELEYDEDGKLAASGKVNHELLALAKGNPFYAKEYPKSLSNQWVQTQVIPFFQNKKITLPDRLATAVELIAWEFAIACEQVELKDLSILLTGGGAFNKCLVQEMQKSVSQKNIQLEIPDNNLVQFKEALLMALMGYLKMAGANNIFGKSTGSNINHCAGNLCVPNSI